MDIAIFLAWIEHQDDATKTEVIDLINQDNDLLYQTISSDRDILNISDSDYGVLSELFVECVLDDHRLFHVYDCGSEYYAVWRACSSNILGIHFFYYYEDGYIEEFKSRKKLEEEVERRYEEYG